jgi:hypothetical protein
VIKAHVVASLLFYAKGEKERDGQVASQGSTQCASGKRRAGSGNSRAFVNGSGRGGEGNRQKAKGTQGTAVAAAYLRAYEYAWAWVHCTAPYSTTSTVQSPKVLFSKEGMEKQAYWQWQACAIPCSDSGSKITELKVIPSVQQKQAIMESVPVKLTQV